MSWFDKKDKWNMTDSERQSDFYKEWLLSGLLMAVIVAICYGLYLLYNYLVS